jgi:BirA family biotin operon repressor/biotin-[acetyl-CoA-carboxylase] ligase
MTSSPAPRPPLDLDRLTAPAGWRVEVVESTPSTNAAVAERARTGEEPGLVLVTEHQTAGRGRLDRSWETPARSSLTFSVLLRPDVPPASWSWLPLLTGYAVQAALADRLPDVALKWPNDVLVEEDDWRKVCGVLCEVHPGGVVVGFGVNVTQAREELPVENATSLALCGAPDVRREDLIVACLRHLVVLHGDLMAGGTALEAVRAAYRSACRTVGMVVDLNTGGASRRVPAVGVDDEGRLIVHGESGEYAVAAGDVVHVREARG